MKSFHPLFFSKKISFLLTALLAVQIISAQEIIDYNEYYKFPFSAGFEYVSVNPLQDYGFDSSMTEVFGIFRLPFQNLPRLQLTAALGIVNFNDLNRDVPDRWDHTQYFAELGAAWVSRFSKTFEISGELMAGLSESVFKNIDPQGTPRGALNFTATAGARVSLDPSYSFSLDVHPFIRYSKYIGTAENFGLFDGFTFGLGISGHYRFGQDPDAPQAKIRSIKFTTDKIPSVFSAMQSYYVNNPIGKIEITNTEKFTVYDVEVSFFQQGYMDNPTKSASIPELQGGETAEIDIFASFNDAVFSRSGVTPLTGEIKVDYIWNNKPVTQVSSVSYDLYDKTSLTWDDDRKVGAFITSTDSALRNYSSAIKQYANPDIVGNFSEALQAAMLMYYALEELGIIYQIDPTSPFDAAQENPVIVDSISLPRDTLIRLTGDCDDLTVVYCALLEAIGIETAFITVPGHIFAAFNTGVLSKDFRLVHNDQTMTLSIDNTLWVPVEITMIGTKDFLYAWRTGIDEFLALDETPEKRAFIKTDEAQQIFRSVGFKETDLGLQYGDKAEIVKNFRNDMGSLIDNIIEDYTERAEKSRRKLDYNKLGIVAAEFGRIRTAEDAFNAALAIDRNYLNPKINLGNLYYLEEEYQEALRNYLNAEKTMVDLGKEGTTVYPKVLLNIARTYYELENYDRVSEYTQRVKDLDPDLLMQFAYLNTDTAGEGRAADIGAYADILFIDEEE